MNGSRPRVKFLINKRNWAFDFSARSMAHRLRDRFDMEICSVRESPNLSPDRFDLLFVMWWGETWHQQFDIPRSKVMKFVASHRWSEEEQYGRLSPEQFVDRYLNDCQHVTTCSQRLYHELAPVVSPLFCSPEGCEPSIFPKTAAPQGRMKVGWVGNPLDRCKGLFDIIIPACGDQFDLTRSSGKLNREQVARLYRDVDVLVIASTAEGEPLPLIEGMSSGCYPVSVDVGVVPEIVKNPQDGMIIDRSVDALRHALEECEQRLDEIRVSRGYRSQRVRQLRSWDLCSERFADVFNYAIQSQTHPQTNPPSSLPAPLAELAHTKAGSPGFSKSFWKWDDLKSEVREFSMRHVGRVRHRLSRAA